MSYPPAAPPNPGAPYYGPLAPEPAAVQPRPKGPSGSYLAIVLGTALFIGAAIIGCERWGGLGLLGTAPLVASAAALTVIGLGIAFAGGRGRTSGALGVFAVLGLIGTLALAFVTGAGYANNNGFTRIIHGFGDTNWTQNQGGYDVAMTDRTIDLSNITPASLTADRTIPVDVAFGNVTILIPADVPVVLRPDSAFASISVDTADTNEEVSGISDGQEITVNHDATGYQLILEIDGAFSNVHVTTKDMENAQ